MSFTDDLAKLGSNMLVGTEVLLIAGILGLLKGSWTWFIVTLLIFGVLAASKPMFIAMAIIISIAWGYAAWKILALFGVGTIGLIITSFMLGAGSLIIHFKSNDISLDDDSIDGFIDKINEKVFKVDKNRSDHN